MYKVLCDGYELLNPNNENLILNNPILELEDNSSGSFSFSIAPNHPYYNRLIELVSEVVIERDGTEIWSGRVIDAPENMWKQKNVRCEGELSYLNDTTQPMAEYHGTTVRGFLESLLAVHNSKAGSDKQFSIGIVTVTGYTDSILRYTNRETTLYCIKDKLVDRYGGHLRIRKVNGVRYLDYLQDSPRTSEQVIRFGENLLSYAKDFELTDLATVVIPLGAQLDTTGIDALTAYTTIESVNNGKDYIQSSSAVSTYGWIEQVVHFDDITEPSNLKTKGQEYLADVQYANMVLEVGAVDLHNVDVSYDTIEMLDTVRVISTPHGMDRYFPVSKMTVNLTDATKNKLVLGNKVKTSMTGATKSANTELVNRIQSIPPVSTILQSAKDNATQLIKNALNGHVVITDDASELLIMDTDDIETATKVWRFNLNGLGYSNSGYDGEYGLALTMDGKIVADFITTGTLNANLIKAGVLEDTSGNTSWNMVTGEMTAKNLSIDSTNFDLDSSGNLTAQNATLTGATVNGTITSESGTKKATMDNGLIQGYINGQLAGQVDLSPTYISGNRVGTIWGYDWLELQAGAMGNDGAPATRIVVDSSGIHPQGLTGTVTIGDATVTLDGGLITNITY